VSHKDDMLSLVRSARLARPQARMMSTLLEKVTADIPKIKEMAAASGAAGGYDVADLKKDLAAGSVDISKLQVSMAAYPDIQKMASKMISEMNAYKSKPAPAPIDWAAWDAKIETPGLVDAMKVAYEAEINNKEFEDTLAADLAKESAAIDAMFNGADGLFAKAKAEEKAADAGLLQCIADLELLEKQIDGVSEQTIAEILEMEPELRKEVEEEIDNSNWAP